MLKERDQTRRDAHDLLGRNVGVVHVLRVHLSQLAVDACDDRLALELALNIEGVGRCQNSLHLLVGSQVDGLASHLAALDLAVRRLKEAVRIDLRIETKRRDQTDVRAFRRLDRTDAPVVRDVNVAHLEARALAVQTARPERRQTTLVHQRTQRVRLVDDLRQLTAPEEEVDRARDALRVHKVADLRQLVGILDTHALLHRPAKLQETLAELLHCQLIECAEAAVAQVVDVVDLRDRTARLGVDAVRTKVEQILDDLQEVLARQELLVLGRLKTELAVDAESANATQAVAVVVVELLIEKLLGLLDLRRVARAELAVDLEHRAPVVRVRLHILKTLVRDRVQDQHVRRVLDDLDLLHRRCADRLGRLADLVADVDDLLARLGVDDRLGRPVALVHVRGLHLGDVIEQAQDRLGRRHALVQTTQERRRRKTRRLIDLHRQPVLLVDRHLDPRATLGDDPRRVQRAVRLARRNAEVHARRAVQLAHDHALGTVHDELAAAHHDREVAEVDVFLGDLVHTITHQLDADPERHAVRQPQLPALVRVVPRAVQTVRDILETHRPVVALDRKDLVQKRLKPEGRVATGFVLRQLQKSLVCVGLNLSKIGNGKRVAALLVIAHFHRGHRAPRDGSRLQQLSM